MDMSSASESSGNPRFKLSESLPSNTRHKLFSFRTGAPTLGGWHTPRSRGQGDSHTPHNIELLLDIHTSMEIRSLAIFNNYVAFIPRNEVRVVKIALLAERSLQSPSGSMLGGKLNIEDPTPAVSQAPTPWPDSAHTCKVRRSIWFCKCAMY